MFGSLLSGALILTVFKKIALGISLAAPIGPVSLEVIRRGTARGFRAAYSICLGAAIGDFLCLLAIFLLGNTFNTFLYSQSASPEQIQNIAKMLVWFLGSFLLLRMGWGCIKDSYNQHLRPENALQFSDRNSIVLGILLAIANPMSLTWWAGVYGQEVLEGQGFTIESFNSLLLNTWIIVGVLLWAIVLSTLASQGKKLGTSFITWVSLLAGLCLTAFGLSYGWSAIKILFTL